MDNREDKIRKLRKVSELLFKNYSKRVLQWSEMEAPHQSQNQSDSESQFVTQLIQEHPENKKKLTKLLNTCKHIDVLVEQNKTIDARIKEMMENMDEASMERIFTCSGPALEKIRKDAEYLAQLSVVSTLLDGQVLEDLGEMLPPSGAGTFTSLREEVGPDCLVKKHPELIKHSDRLAKENCDLRDMLKDLYLKKMMEDVVPSSPVVFSYVDKLVETRLPYFKLEVTRRTKMCPNYKNCQYGKYCFDAHTPADMGTFPYSRPFYYKTRKCKLGSRCPKVPNCTYIHP